LPLPSGKPYSIDKTGILGSFGGCLAERGGIAAQTCRLHCNRQCSRRLHTTRMRQLPQKLRLPNLMSSRLNRRFGEKLGVKAQ
jgi:hypothetical protein